MPPTTRPDPAAQTSAPPSSRPSERRRALVVRGGWDGHVPVESTDLFIPFLRESGFEVEVSETLDVYLDSALLAATDLVVQCWTMGSITEQQQSGLNAAVRAGTGLAGWHGGIVDAFRENFEYELMTGGRFVMHPPGFYDHQVSVAEEHAEHPVVAGLDTFTVHTEQYWMHTDEHNQVLATTVFTPGEDTPWQQPVTAPAVWTRQWGAGRVFVSTLGHKLDDFDVPEVRTLTERGLLWASR